MWILGGFGVSLKGKVKVKFKIQKVKFIFPSGQTGAVKGDCQSGVSKGKTQITGQVSAKCEVSGQSAK